MAFNTLLVEDKDGIRRITLNRPDKLNALNRGLERVEQTLRTEFMSNLARTNRRDAHEMMAEIFNGFDRHRSAGATRRGRAWPHGAGRWRGGAPSLISSGARPDGQNECQHGFFLQPCESIQHRHQSFTMVSSGG